MWTDRSLSWELLAACEKVPTIGWLCAPRNNLRLKVLKPVAIMGASAGIFGTARAQYHLRQMFVFLDMYPVNQPKVMIGQAQQRFDTNGNLTDETSKKATSPADASGHTRP